MGLQEYFVDVPSCLVFCSVLALATGVLFEMLNKAIMGFVRTKPWCPQAMDLQKALCKNFGYKEEDCTYEAMLDMYSFVLVFCGHHLVAGLLMVPVVVMGWEAAGSTWQLCFIVAALADVSLDMFDVFKNFIRTFLYKHLPWSSPCPLAFFIMICCLHHPLAMGMVIPMIINYPAMRSFHLICISLLLAAGICFTTGAYKFTLDVKSKGGFLQYKAIVLAQLVTILFTRGYVWFVQVYTTLSTFYSTGDTKFFVAGIVAAALMSLFNVVMILDSIDAAVKWLPRPLPTEDHEHEELTQSILRSTSSHLGAPHMLADLLSPEVKHFRANVKAVVAAGKFKRALHKKD